MITTKQVKEALKVADIQASSVKKYDEGYPYWEVRLEPQCFVNREIVEISKVLDEAMITFRYSGHSLLMCIHPYFKNY